MQPHFSLVSPPYRGNTDSYDGELALAFGGFLLSFGFVALFVLVWGVFVFSFPIIKLCFLPFNDDLGTPPTWRPYSWKKKVGVCLAFGVACVPYPLITLCFLSLS